VGPVEIVRVFVGLGQHGVGVFVGIAVGAAVAVRDAVAVEVLVVVEVGGSVGIWRGVALEVAVGAAWILIQDTLLASLESLGLLTVAQF